jgi:hypothetical protein
MKLPRFLPADIVLLMLASALCIIAYRATIISPATTTAIGQALSVESIHLPMLDSAVARVMRRNVFETPLPAPELGDEQQKPVAIPAPLPISDPGIAVRAIAGPPWVAVLSGLPGQSSQRVVIAGDTSGVYRIRSITSDSVTIQSPDSLIRVSLNGPEHP